MEYILFFFFFFFFQQNLKAFYEPELSDKDTKFQWLEKNKKKTKNQLRPQIHF